MMRELAPIPKAGGRSSLSQGYLKWISKMTPDGEKYGFYNGKSRDGFDDFGTIGTDDYGRAGDDFEFAEADPA